MQSGGSNRNFTICSGRSFHKEWRAKKIPSNALLPTLFSFPLADSSK